MAAGTESSGDTGISPFPLRAAGNRQGPAISWRSLGCDNTARVSGFPLWRVTGLAIAPPGCSELQLSVSQRCHRTGVRSGGLHHGHPRATASPGHPRPREWPRCGARVPTTASRQNLRLRLCRAGYGISMETPGSGGAGLGDAISTETAAAPGCGRDAPGTGYRGGRDGGQHAPAAGRWRLRHPGNGTAWRQHF